jgi:hypothetical protein
MDLDMEKDMDTDLDTNTDTAMAKDMDTDLELEYFCWISIQHYSPYSAVTYDTSWRNSQWHYKLVAQLSDENMTCKL